MGGLDKQGGKRPPLKKPKSQAGEVDDDDAAEARARAEKKRQAQKDEKELREKMSGKKGPLNTGSQGIKKSGKK
ncbi:hypothetical protein QQS21_002814 [Conoideocrella luteorostrata]|uniref:Translation machinery associated TMA7 n=1 Tax=Conoideocrella luteorostrata TaxID=1105319 RepID=A0AAJ0CV87_9HYPO|nr:hypothetical protein QQS21_002814 [Conoideocrella luteorostrata]